MTDTVLLAEITRLKKRERALVLMLDEVKETIDDFIDIKDGANGPLPNWAMSLTTQINEVLENQWP